MHKIRPSDPANSQPPPETIGSPAGPPKKKGALWTVLAVLGFFLLKGKSIGLLLLSKGKLLLGLFKAKSLLVVLKTGGTMFLSIWIYALAWPLHFAVGFVVLIFVHEVGHALVLRALGIPFSAPVFIPFVGALIGLKRMPQDAGKEALVAFGGPFLGTIGAQVCLVLYRNGWGDYFRGLAQVGYMLNLFNMAPYSPLDGGRIVGAISPKIWIVALPVMLLAGLWFKSIILIAVTLLGLPRALSSWKKRHDPEQAAYFNVKPSTRLWAAAGYVGLSGFLAYMMYYVQHLTPGRLP
ncbi:MAG: site-2 protease family protein [Deltaproteobacteria bacterium]|nr:site-2 protease family protein [Deltaproteobacteria bacterium]